MLSLCKKEGEMSFFEKRTSVDKENDRCPSF